MDLNKMIRPGEKLCSLRTDKQRWRALGQERKELMVNAYLMFGFGWFMLFFVSAVLLVPDWFNEHAGDNIPLLCLLIVVFTIFGSLLFLKVEETDKLIAEGYTWKHEELLKELQ